MVKNMNSHVNSKSGGTTNSIVSSVLEAAAQLLTRTGYKNSTTNHIAERAGVSIGSLYYYFRGKDAVYRRLADEVMAAYVSRLEKTLAGFDDQTDAHKVLI